MSLAGALFRYTPMWKAIQIVWVVDVAIQFILLVITWMYH